MDESTRHYLISGRVQGVGYRAFTERQARELSLSGWVRNLADGRVECVARGSSDQLTQFEVHLRRGPLLSRVESVVIEDATEPVLENRFEIKRGGVTS